MITIRINTDSAAFDDDPHTELDRILDEVKHKARSESEYFTVLDINGNAVCTVESEE